MNDREFYKAGGRTFAQIVDEELEKCDYLDDEQIKSIRRSIIGVLDTIPPFGRKFRVLPQNLEAERSGFNEWIEKVINRNGYQKVA